MLGNKEAVGKIKSIRTEAKITDQSGRSYQVTTLFIDSERAAYKVIYDDITLVFGADANKVWHYQNNIEVPVNNQIRDMILRQQIHAQILFFDQLHAPVENTDGAKFLQQRCSALYSTDHIFTSLFYDADGYPIGMSLGTVNDLPRDNSEMPIKILFKAWDEFEGIELPSKIRISDGEQVLHYEYNSIRFNVGTLLDFIKG